MFQHIKVLRAREAVLHFRPLRIGQRCYVSAPKSRPSQGTKTKSSTKSSSSAHAKPTQSSTPPPSSPTSAHPLPPGTAARPGRLGGAGAKNQQQRQGPNSQNQSQNSSRQQQQEQKESLAKLIQERKIPFFGLSLVALWMSYYIGKLGVGLYNSSNVDVKRMTAKEFDQSLDFPEWFMGITTLRSKLAQRARGQVLEVAVGTGRNMVYFHWHDPDADVKKHHDNDDSSPTPTVIIPNEVMHYTGIDINDDMLAIAIKRARGIVGKLMADESSFRLVHGDVQQPLPRPPDGKSTKYDTVIQSFGLCSVEDPVELVKNLAAMVKPNFGRILLLEHGRGSWGFINNILDSAAEKHFEKHACWWNRDIEQIVRTAVEQVPGLEIRRLERPNWLQAGTVLLIELRIKHVLQPDGTGRPQADAQKPKSSGWFGFKPKENNDE